MVTRYVLADSVPMGDRARAVSRSLMASTAGTVMLTEAVPPAARPTAEGRAELVMGLAAGGGTLVGASGLAAVGGLPLLSAGVALLGATAALHLVPWPRSPDHLGKRWS